MADSSLQHPIHEHELSLREVIEKSKTCCFFCKRCFHGLAYCCLDCDIFLHKSCALVELPPQIQHPSHPEHPLSLDSTGCRYRCQGCCFDMGALEAIVTNVPPEDEHKEERDRSRLRHLAHSHPLSPFYPRIENLIRCKACLGLISGRVYGCGRCMFFLHEACAQLPQRLQHPFHRKHALVLVKADLDGDDVFGNCCMCRVRHSSSGLMYRCDNCNINHCTQCVVSTLPPEGQEMEEGPAAIECFFHEHRLTPCIVKIEVMVRCQVCRLRISGEVYCYCCFDCALFVHKACSEELTQEMNHYLHQDHLLILRGVDPYNEGTFYCSCCLKRFNGMTFNCESCDFNLDPICALRTLSAVKAGTPAEIQHHFHPHPLTLLYTIDTGFNNIQCAACKESSDGLAYCCKTCTTFKLHKSCAEVELGVKHEFHPAHPLDLLPRAPGGYFYCSACHRKSEGFALSCPKCDFDLDLECAAKKPTLKHERHEHHLAYFPRIEVRNILQCNSCGKSCNRDLYRCVPCNFNLHHDCLPLPPTLQHECHPYHPLILFDKFIYGRPDAQYCDYCEEIRHPDHGVYRCPEELCWYTTHIECVIPIGSPRYNSILVEENQR